jgi:hypothetical protein
MKKYLLLILFAAFNCGLYAMEIGAGYDNDAPSVKVWWNESFGSELSASWSYSKNSGSPYTTNSSLVYTVAPLIWSFYKNQYGSLSLSVKFRNYVNFIQYSTGVSRLTANDYAILFYLPEMEIKLPYLDGLRLIGRIGASFSWGYNDYTGTLNNYSLSFSGLSLATFGILYYFNSTPDAAAEKTVKPESVTPPVPGGVTNTAK